MTIGCNIWMICLKLNWFFYGLSRMLQFSLFSIFFNFLLIDATDRSKINGDKKRFLAHSSYTPYHISRTLPLKILKFQYRQKLHLVFNLHILDNSVKMCLYFFLSVCKFALMLWSCMLCVCLKSCYIYLSAIHRTILFVKLTLFISIQINNILIIIMKLTHQTRCHRSLIFQTMNSVRLNHQFVKI